MTSPLQGGKKRGIGWDGPSLARPHGRRRRWRRPVGAAAAVLAAIALLVTLGAVELDEPAGLGTLATLPAEGGGAEPGRPPAIERRRERQAESERQAQAIAVTGGGPMLSVELEDPPAAGLVFDVETGEILWERDRRGERPIASLTKIMTAVLVAKELGRTEREIQVDGRAEGTEGSAIGLEAGMRVEAGALFNAMLIASANDAADALAIDAAGSTGRFVRRMNSRARELDLDCTHFVSSHGLEPENRSCAEDVAALVRLAMDSGRIRAVAAKERAVVDFPIAGGRRHLASTNPLLQADYPGTIGLKTGYTLEAGRSLAAVVRRDGRTLGAVLLDSPDPALQAERLFDAAFR